LIQQFLALVPIEEQLVRFERGLKRLSSRILFTQSVQQAAKKVCDLRRHTLATNNGQQ
jgi:hypothetical protein